MHFLDRVVQAREERMRGVDRQYDPAKLVFDVIERPILVVPEGNQILRLFYALVSLLVRFPLTPQRHRKASEISLDLRLLIGRKIVL